MKRLAITIIALLALAQPAFAGWYLLAPPANDYAVYSNIPLSRWQQIGAYDTAAECQDDLAQRLLNVESDEKWQQIEIQLRLHGDSSLPRNITILRVEQNRCVTDSDPRLQATR
jgi:hypothetical protein